MSLFNARFPGPLLALLRFSSGALLVFFHGWGKANDAYGYLLHGGEWPLKLVAGNIGFPLPTLFALAATLAEFLGGILLAIGLFTRQAAAALTVSMAVAVYYHLSSDMRFELAALYLAISLAFCLGPATPFSADGMLQKRQRRP
jgi:putative oxidoreductase